MANDEESAVRTTPILRLRSTARTELVLPRQQIPQPDGPWIAHPDLILDRPKKKTTEYAPDITIKEYRDLWKAGREGRMEGLRSVDKKDVKIISALIFWPVINMQRIQGMTDHEIALVVERHYVGAHHYLNPGSFMPPQIIDRFGDDWGMNARGIYYRHYYSPGWVTADHSLWLPSLGGTDWNGEGEASRRSRARVFMKHVLDNEKWNKSEYAWEADAWTDVFGPMRNDPALSVDKHEYNTIGQKTHPVSCLLTGESKYIKRIPDATFGLATFQPKDYQNAVAEWDLDRDRLEALLLHRQSGLISDPRWGGTSLVFPFSVFEAKGWSGNAREARRQACLAGKVYLDLLDDLGRQPGKLGEERGRYQTDQSRNSQVFVYTCFGAHWHILVGYKRPRLEREHAGHQGVSESVYVFQRIWSGRVTTERRAWELLSLVDQIHVWGVTDFRDFVIRHLRPWHEFVRNCHLNDFSFAATLPNTGRIVENGEMKLWLPASCHLLPDWTKHLTDDTRLRLQERMGHCLKDAWSKYSGFDFKELPFFHSCGLEGCGSAADPGYPLASVEEMMMHFREFHGADDEEVAFWTNVWETDSYKRLPKRKLGPSVVGELLTPRSSRKRGPVETIGNIRVSKRSRR